MSAASTTITLRNDLSEIPRLAGLVGAFGAEHGLPTRLILEVNLALEETLTNVVTYGYRDARDHDIVVRLSLDTRELSVEVIDDGQPFNPLEARSVDFDVSPADRPIGGLGIHIVRSVMDAIEYRREDDRNVLTMRKKTGF